MDQNERLLGIVITHLPGIVDAAGWEVATSWRLTLHTTTQTARAIRKELDAIDANHMSRTTSTSMYLYTGIMPGTWELETLLNRAGLDLRDLTGAGIPDIAHPSIMISIS
jgi:hypothetical protein